MRDQAEGLLDDGQEAVGVAHEVVGLALGDRSGRTGLSRRALSVADTVVTIPMAHGVDSLNVASAAAVALYALRVPPTAGEIQSFGADA